MRQTSNLVSTTEPLVSIIIPTYNRAHLIAETLDSVLAQTYKNWECIVVDDGSTDETDLLMKGYISKDSRFQYHHRPADRLPGGNAARNYGFEISKGEYINWLDSDDLISINKINDQIKCLENNWSKDILSTCKWGIFEDSKNSKNLFEALYVYRNYDNIIFFLKDLYKQYGYFPAQTYLVHKSIVSKSGGWNEYLTINQDNEFFTRVICNCNKINFSKNAYVLYRTSRKDSTSLITENKIFDYYQSWKLIENILMIRFKKEMPDEFKTMKRNSFLRIPLALEYIYSDDKVFYNACLKERRYSITLKKRIKRFLIKHFK